jgi:hypothetical protein
MGCWALVKLDFDLAKFTVAPLQETSQRTTLMAHPTSHTVLLNFNLYLRAGPMTSAPSSNRCS